MSEYIPYELIVDILTRLPVKSLLRFTLVCKSWYSLITSPDFIATHLNQTILNNKIKNPILLVRHYSKNDKKEHYKLRGEDETFGVTIGKLEFPFKSTFGYFRIVGSCNGLICLTDDFARTIILWNPSVRKWVTIPNSNNPQWPPMFTFGFGIDPSTLDFKVVRVGYKNGGISSYQFPPKVEIYTLSTGSWRTINSATVPYFMMGHRWPQALVNGAVHWIAHNPRVELGVFSLIVSFDMCDEVFHEIMLPGGLATKIVSNLFISVLRESLAVIKYDRETRATSCCVWVMREYGVAESWTRLSDIDLDGISGKIVGFRKNGDVLLSQGNNKLAVAYDPKTRQMKDLGTVGTLRSFYVDTYMETLFLLKDGMKPRRGS